MTSLSRERLFGLERDCVVRGPKVASPLATRSNAGVNPPRTFLGSLAPHVTKGPGIRQDVFAFRGQEGLVHHHDLSWPTTAVTVSLLVRVRSVAARQALIACDDGSQRSFSLASQAGGALRWQVHYGPATYSQTTANAYSPGFWRWVTAVYQAGSLRLYVNLNYSATVVGPVSWNYPTAPVTVGWRDEAGSEDRLDADVAWFAVWTRALMPAQIRDLHRRPRPPLYDPAFSIGNGSFPARRAFAPIVSAARLSG